MAVCDHCDQEMTVSVACTWKPTVEVEGVPRERISYPPDGDTSYPVECRDCGTPQGGLHHPGCHAERCPGCGGQAIGCGCHWEGDEDEEEGDGCSAVIELVSGFPMSCGQPSGHDGPHEHGEAGVVGVAYARWRDNPDGSVSNEFMQLP